MQEDTRSNLTFCLTVVLLLLLWSVLRPIQDHLLALLPNWSIVSGILLTLVEFAILRLILNHLLQPFVANYIIGEGFWVNKIILRTITGEIQVLESVTGREYELAIGQLNIALNKFGLELRPQQLQLVIAYKISSNTKIKKNELDSTVRITRYEDTLLWTEKQNGLYGDIHILHVEKEVGVVKVEVIDINADLE